MSEREPTEQELRRAPVVPGFELPTTVTKHRSVVMTRGLQPEDLGVLDYLKLRDPRLPATKEELSAEMQRELGWKMGKTRFDGIFGRLKAAGHIKHHCPYNPETGRPEWVIEFFLEPTNNDQYVNSGIREASQVAAETPETRDPAFDHFFETPETNVSPGQKGSQVSRDPEGNPWKPGFPSGPVSAGQNRNPENPGFGVHPPHPPEGGGNSSPKPPKRGRATGTERLAAACELAPEDYQPSAQEIAAADAFWQDLPGKWQMGPEEARILAPLLASRVHTQGYELDEYLELVLTQDDPAKPAQVPARVMPYRVRNLKRRRPEEKPDPHEQSAAGGLPDWCGVCNRGDEPRMIYQRTRELPDGSDVPCEACHPKYARTTA